ncbi:MAG: winged helix-turn-helix domain-containing protein [Dysgonamonadaceae bacterium]|jgi:galactitol-specific phosphotransferase system IIB component|nr:winged helix-turn-helix domain-containing protein [Dysgonamonadaceae bacterium]
MKNLFLLIDQKNYTLAENIKKFLEELGHYQVQIETKLVENHSAEQDNSDSFICIEEKEPSFRKISPIKEPIFLGEYILDMNRRTLQWKDQQFFHLSHKETKILEELIENTGRIVTRNFLLYNYWGEVSYYKSRSLDVLISRLRKYLSLDPSVEIVNYRSEGLQIIY